MKPKKWVEVKLKSGEKELIPFGWQYRYDWSARRAVFEEIKGEKRIEFDPDDIEELVYIKEFTIKK